METFSLQSVLMTSLLALNISSPSVQEAKIGTYELPVIAGLWQLQKDDESAQADMICHEQYNFGQDGNLTTVSGVEKTYGYYRYRIQEEGLPVLAVKTVYDNNAPDCSNTQIDQSGQTFATFVSLDSRDNPTRMYWCDDGQGKNCTTTLKRILP